MSSSSSIPTRLWVIIAHGGRVVNMTSDAAHVPFMRRYVEQARDAGDGWSLLEYNLSKDLTQESLSKAT